MRANTGYACLAAVILIMLFGCALTNPRSLNHSTASKAPHESQESGDVIRSWLRAAEQSQRAGDPTSARALGEQALEEAISRSTPRLQAAAEVIIGNALLALGEIDEARRHLVSGISIARSEALAPVEAVARLNLGNLHRLTGEFEVALAEYEAASALARSIGDSALAVRGTTNALRARALLGRSRAHGASAAPRTASPALPHFEASIQQVVDEISGVEDPSLRGELALHAGRSLLIALESVEMTSGPVVRRAGEFLTMASEACELSADEALMAEIFGERGRLYQVAGREADARRLTEQALHHSQLAGSEANRIRWHIQLAGLHRAAGRIEESRLQYERAVGLLQRHRRALSDRSRLKLSDVESRESIRSVYLGYVDVLLTSARGATQDSERRHHLMIARDTLEQFKAAELRDYFEDECVDQTRARITPIEEVAQGVAVLYPIILSDRLELLVWDAQGIHQYAVEVAEAELRETIARFRQLLVKRTTHQYRGPARRLYDWLIGPIEDSLDQGGIETLVFVPDGPLRTIPIAALHDGSRFLIERFAIATTPGVELTDPQPLRREGLEVLLGGLTQASKEFPALPYVQQELFQIHEMLGGEILLDDDFQKSKLERMIVEHDFGVVHLATHAVFDSQSSSGFLVTQDGRFGLNDFANAIAGNRYREKPLELLVLSACETAVGDERAALGLSGIAIKAGARSVVGSLWKVRDETASKAMVGFYEALRVPGTSRAEALRRSQRALLERPRSRHPADWSAFLLLNSWL